MFPFGFTYSKLFINKQTVTNNFTSPIKGLRIQRGWSQRQLALSSGLRNTEIIISKNNRSVFAKTSKENEANIYATKLMAYISVIDKSCVIGFLENGLKQIINSMLKLFVKSVYQIKCINFIKD